MIKHKRSFVYISLLFGSMLVLSGCGNKSPEAANQAAEGTVQAFKVKKQDPLSLDGQADFHYQDVYQYEKAKGKINQVAVSDKQLVIKDQLLYSYVEKASTRELEDEVRLTTRLEEDRRREIQQLSWYTGLEYDAWGNQIATTWDNYGNKSGATIVQSINENPNYMVSGEDQDQTHKKTIRELNQKIEDSLIKQTRLKEDQAALQVKADRAGVVTLKEENVDKEGLPLIEILSDEVVVKGEASQYQQGRLATGQKVTLYVEAEDRTINGEIIEVSDRPTSSQPVTNTDKPVPATTDKESKYKFIIRSEERIPVGYTVKVSIAQSAISLPKSAIIEQDKKEFVYLYKDGKTQKTPIKSEKRAGQVIITEGVKVDDIVITNPATVEEGQAVEEEMLQITGG